MNKKSAISIGILLMCMAAIILFGQKQLLHADVDAENSKVQKTYMTENGQELEITTSPSIIDADIYAKDLEQIENSTDTATSNENTEGESKSDKQTQEDAKKIREEEALEAIRIKNPEIKVSAKAAVLMNAASKEVLYSKKALDEIQPASTAKLLTAIVAIELSDKKEEFTVGPEINLIAPDSSRAYLVQGQVLSLEQILDALLLPSGNDAAYVIAANLGRKLAGDNTLKPKAAVKKFLKKMNETADEIGVVHSNFQSPDGYDAEGQYTTAYDMALIATKSLQYDEILATVKKAKTRDILLSGEDVTWYNSNKLVKEGSGYYYKYAIGLKTGSSGEAGRCLISAAKKAEDVYISVVMDASYEGRWQDSIDLLSYAIE